MMKTYRVRVDILVSDTGQRTTDVKAVQVVRTCDTLKEARAFARELVALANRKL